jgi:signal transduction histidine kinase
MNGILASAHLLASSPTLGPEERDCVDIVIDSSNAMTRLLDDLLLCTRMGTGRFELAPSPTRIDKLVKSISDVMLSRLQPPASMMMHRSNSGGGGVATPPLPPPRVRWHVVTDPALPTAIMVDADRVKQVLLNLTDNALKVRVHFLRRTVGLLLLRGDSAQLLCCHVSLALWFVAC